MEADRGLALERRHGGLGRPAAWPVLVRVVRHALQGRTRPRTSRSWSRADTRWPRPRLGTAVVPGAWPRPPGKAVLIRSRMILCPRVALVRVLGRGRWPLDIVV